MILFLTPLADDTYSILRVHLHIWSCSLHNILFSQTWNRPRIWGPFTTSDVMKWLVVNLTQNSGLCIVYCTKMLPIQIRVRSCQLQNHFEWRHGPSLPIRGRLVHPDYQHYPPCISLTTHHLTQMAPGSTGNMHCLEKEWKLTEQKVKALATYLAFSN